MLKPACLHRCSSHGEILLLFQPPQLHYCLQQFNHRYQCLITCVICYVLGHMGEITRTNGSKSILDDFPIVTFDFKKAIEVMPLSLIFVGMITFNNLCLQYVQVSFCKFGLEFAP